MIQDRKSICSKHIAQNLGKVIGKSPQFPYRKPICYLNKSKIKTNSHLIFLPIGKIIRDDSTKTGYTLVKNLKINRNKR